MTLNDKYPFTDEDRTIINSYKAVVDGVSALIGEHCEIVLHSLEDIELLLFVLLTDITLIGKLVRQSPILPYVRSEICKAKVFQSLILHEQKAAY